MFRETRLCDPKALPLEPALQIFPASHKLAMDTPTGNVKRTDFGRFIYPPVVLGTYRVSRPLHVGGVGGAESMSIHLD